MAGRIATGATEHRTGSVAVTHRTQTDNQTESNTTGANRASDSVANTAVTITSGTNASGINTAGTNTSGTNTSGTNADAPSNVTAGSKTVKASNATVKSDVQTETDIQAAGNSGKVDDLKDQPWLALDTATANMTIAVMRGMQVLAQFESTAWRNHSVRLIPEIQELLQQTGIRMRDIRAIAVGNGPGSYTGVRVGVTVAKTLAWSLDLPLVNVSSIGALALGYVRHYEQQKVQTVDETIDEPVNEPLDENQRETIPSDETIWIVPLLDGRRKQVFTGLYSWRNSLHNSLQNSLQNPLRSQAKGSSTQEGVQDRVSDKVSDRVSEDRVPDRVSDRVSDRVPVTASEAGSDAVESDQGIRLDEAGLRGYWHQIEQDRIVLFSEWSEFICKMASQLPVENRPGKIVFVGEKDGIEYDEEALSTMAGTSVSFLTQNVHAQDIALLAWHRFVKQQFADIHGLVPNYTQLAEAEKKLLSR